MAGLAPLRMPAHLIERARALVGAENADWEVPPTRHAATVVITTDSANGLHVYLQRRVRTMAFAAGMYVFPGGAVEESDVRSAHELQAALAPSSGFMSHDPGEWGVDTLAARIAAVRETEEEAAISLGDPTVLAYIAHWVTPEVEAKRFDTRFYAAVVNAEADVHESSQETDAQKWLRPQDALDEYFAGNMMMLPPTVAVLSAFAQQVAGGSDAATAVANLAAKPVVPLMPSPFAIEGSDEIGWRLVDFRTGNEVMVTSGPPAGSEVDGVNDGAG